MRELPVQLTLSPSASFPVTLTAGQKLEFDAVRFVQAYPLIEFDAAPDTEIRMSRLECGTWPNLGPQSHFTIDTRGLSAAQSS